MNKTRINTIRAMLRNMSKYYDQALDILTDFHDDMRSGCSQKFEFSPKFSLQIFINNLIQRGSFQT